MKTLTVFVFVFFTLSVLAHDSKYKHKHKFEPAIFEVIPLNSPVKESMAKFSLKLPAGFVVDKVKVKLVNAFDLKKDQKKFEEIKIVNNELQVSISKLPPGFYRLYVTVIDHGTKREHEFKTNYHDFVRFVIDESLEVPMPDPKIDNATIAGVDKDSNGIPDRIQRYINETYSTQPKLRLAVQQYARAIQADLLSADDKALSIQAARKGLDTLSCLSFVVGSEQTAKIVNKMPALFLNTKERIVAEMKGNQNFSGQSYRLPDDEEQKFFCDFDVDAF